MADLDQQSSILAEKTQRPSLLEAITSDSYTLLLAVALLVLSVSLAVLAIVAVSHYGLGSKPASAIMLDSPGKPVQPPEYAPRITRANGDMDILST